MVARAMHSTQRSLTLTLSLCRSTATKGLNASSCTPTELKSGFRVQGLFG